MEIKTERLRLRKLQLSDLDKVHQLHSLPETDKYNTLGIPDSVGETRNHVINWMDEEKEPRKRFTFCIENNEKEFVGLFGIKLGKPAYRSAEVWYKLVPEFWNLGYATECVTGILDFCFKELKLHRIEAGCAVENTASARVMEKAGMTREGRKRKILPIRGEWVDNYMYAILEEDYRREIKKDNWISHPLVLEGKRVKLVPLEKFHYPELTELAKDERIWEFMPIDWLGQKGMHATLDEALVQKDAGTQYPFVVIDKVTDKIIGSTRFLRLSKEFRNLEIGWTWYRPEYWNTGYNKECKYLLLRYCFETLKTISVHIGTAETNTRSRRAIESLGAKYEGTFRNRFIWKGEKKSSVVYSIVDDEWPKIKPELEQGIIRQWK